jgi:hypothetical protein
LPVVRDALRGQVLLQSVTEGGFGSRRSAAIMNRKEDKSNTEIRRDVRYPQLSELSMIYEGFEEDVCVRPPDLSPHGMFINTSTEYPEGAVLKLRFKLSRTGVVIQTRCEVRYCLKGVGVGVEFVAMPPESVRAIEEEIGVVTKNW